MRTDRNGRARRKCRGHAIPRLGRRDMGIEVPQRTTFCEDRAGELYVAARKTGTVYRITGGARYVVARLITAAPIRRVIA
jgi:hypothetical protein